MLTTRWRSAWDSEITAQTRIQSLRIYPNQAPGLASRGEGPAAILPKVVGAPESWVTCRVPDPFSCVVNPHNKAMPRASSTQFTGSGAFSEEIGDEPASTEMQSETWIGSVPNLYLCPTIPQTLPLLRKPGQGQCATSY